MTYLKKLQFNIFILIRRVVYLILGLTHLFPWHHETGIVVFCYHSVQKDTWHFSVDPKMLERQTEYLLKYRKPISAEDLLLHVRGERVITEPSFLITFDDGYKDILVTKDFFKEHGIDPIVFVLADTKNVDRRQTNTEKPFLSQQDIFELKNAGWSIGCHSATHADFGTLTRAACMTEIVESKKQLELQLGSSVYYFAYPKGVYTSTTSEFVNKAGYKLAFTMDEGFVDDGDNPITLSRIGVDRTHTFAEFKTLATPITLSFRKLVKQFLH